MNLNRKGDNSSISATVYIPNMKIVENGDHKKYLMYQRSYEKCNQNLEGRGNAI